MRAAIHAVARLPGVLVRLADAEEGTPAARSAAAGLAADLAALHARYGRVAIGWGDGVLRVGGRRARLAPAEEAARAACEDATRSFGVDGIAVEAPPAPEELEAALRALTDGPADELPRRLSLRGVESVRFVARSVAAGALRPGPRAWRVARALAAARQGREEALRAVAHEAVAFAREAPVACAAILCAPLPWTHDAAVAVRAGVIAALACRVEALAHPEIAVEAAVLPDPFRVRALLAMEVDDDTWRLRLSATCAAAGAAPECPEERVAATAVAAARLWLVGGEEVALRRADPDGRLGLRRLLDAAPA